MRRKTGHVFVMGYTGTEAHPKNLAPLGWIPNDQVESVVGSLPTSGLGGIVLFERGFDQREDLNALLKHVHKKRSITSFVQAEPRSHHPAKGAP